MQLTALFFIWVTSVSALATSGRIPLLKRHNVIDRSLHGLVLAASCPAGSVTCSNGGCCAAGYYCDGPGCCPNGKVCDDTLEPVCADRTATLCTGQDFCCAAGLFCVPGDCSSTAGGGVITTRTSIRRTSSIVLSTASYVPSIAFSSPIDQPTPSPTSSPSSPSSPAISSSAPAATYIPAFPSSSVTSNTRNISVQASDSSITYSGSWSSATSGCDSSHIARRSTTGGDFLVYSFRGTAIYATGQAGQFLATIDGQSAVRVDGTKATAIASDNQCAVLWSAFNLVDSSHTLRIALPTDVSSGFSLDHFIVAQSSSSGGTVSSASPLYVSALEKCIGAATLLGAVFTFALWV